MRVMPGGALVFGATVYADGEGAGNGDDTLDEWIGRGPPYESRGEEVGF